MEPTDFQTLAERMYPNMRGAAPTAVPAAAAAPAPLAPSTPGPQEPSALPAPAPAPAPGEPTGLLDAHADPEMQALRNDVAERMYNRPQAERMVPENVFEALVGTQVEVEGELVEFDVDMARKGTAELRAIAGDLNLTQQDLAAANEGLAFAQTIRGDEQKTIAARESAVELLTAEYGTEASLAARAARAYVAKNPKLAAMLEMTGAGDAPQVIALVARRALGLHKAGKLTVPGAAKEPSAQQTGAQRMYPGMNP